MYGWTGRRLKVYLSEGKIVKEEIPEELRLDFLGGRGLNSKTLFDEVKPGIDPLGPDNILIVGIGPLNGTAAPCSGRWTLTAKSPLTDIHGDGNGGGDFAAELKFAGYDQLIFYGQSPKPVYLWINDDKVEIRDASHLWGLNTWETHDQLVKDTHDPEVREICIGPAGENKVLFAIVTANGTRPAARTGMGTVMGSKNLKAVAVRGTGSVKIARPDEFFKEAKHFYQILGASPYFQMFGKEGSLYLMRAMGSMDQLGTRNQQHGYFKQYEKLSPAAYHAQYRIKSNACFTCPIHCGSYYEVKEEPYATHGEAPEFGCVAMFGNKIVNDNLAAALKAVTLCDQLGLDTGSCGPTIAFAMEAWERGLLTAEDCDNLDLSWGNMDTVMQLLPKIAYREGFGNLLADGSKKASKQIPGSEVCLVEVKGLEWMSAYPGLSAQKGGVLAESTSTRGADHLRGYVENLVYHPRLREFGGEEMVESLKNRHTYLGRGALQAIETEFKAAFDSLALCYFMLGWTIEGGQLELDHDDLARLFSPATGVDMSGDDLLKIGERIYNVERAFNAREGLRRKDDTPPQRLFVEEIHGRPTIGVDPIKYQAMLDEYYEFKGWDKEGIPTKKKLDELNLGYIAEQIGAR